MQGLLDNQLKEFMITRLERYAIKLKNYQKKRGLQAFLENQRRADVKKKVIQTFLKSQTGQKYRAFEKWKNLPSKRKLQKKRSVSDIELTIFKFTQNRLNYGFEKLKEIWYEIREIKRKYLRQMIYITQDKKKRMFNTWANASKHLRYISVCKSTISMFEIL